MAKSEIRGRVTLADALRRAEAAAPRVATVFKHGTLEVEFYAPRGVDPQSPHTRDEDYVIVRGSGFFMSGGERARFGPGDFLFAPAGMEHRFEGFSDDLAVWVIFHGPEGGEPP